MKNLKFLSIVALIVFSLIGCKSDDGFQAPIDIPTTVDGVKFPFASVENFVIEGPIDVPVDADFNKLVKDKTSGLLDLDNVKGAELKELSIELNDSSFVGDLTAVKDAELYVRAENPNVKEIKIAEIKNNQNANVLKFNVVTDQNLIDYFKSEKLVIVLRNIKGGSGSLTTFTVTIKPVWRFSFGL